MFKRSLILLFLSVPALAESEAAEIVHEIPWGTIGIQAYNCFLLLALLAYLLHRMVIEHFEGRRKAYVEMVKRAENARAEAERNHHEIARKLQDLESSSQDSMRMAKIEAEDLRTKLMQEARGLGKKLEEDARRTIEMEALRAKADLRAGVLAAALEQSRDTLHRSLGSSEQKRLEKEFVDKIQVVGQ